jgi:hypothetical protein
MRLNKWIDTDLLVYTAIAIIVIVVSCSSHKNENICKQATKLRGEVVSIIPHGKYRTVTLETITGRIVVYDVPYEQPITTELPACKNKHGEWTWVMP